MAYGGRSQLKMSEETFDFVCTACARSNKKVEAVKYCVECSGYCCQPCTDLHMNFPTLTGHNISDITHSTTASGQQAILTEFPTERCSIHKSKVLDMFCEHHGTVGCYVCFAKDHKSCQDSQIHSIPDMIDTLFNLSDSKQTHQLLQKMIASMTTLSESKDTELGALNKAKKEVLDKVTTLEKALEALLKKAAESSKNEVLAAYRELEKDILQDKHSADRISDDLQTTDDKLKQSEGNRAQKFVCTKLGQALIKAAEDEKIKLELKRNADVQISFVPDQALTEYMKALQGIGQVQKRGHQRQNLYQQQKHDLYKIKQTRDINIRLSDDSKTCWSHGCCLTHDNQLLATDAANKKLKRIDVQKMSVVDYCTLDAEPYGVCCISKYEVAVACSYPNKIQFVSIQGKLSLTRHIKMSHVCYGIAFNDDKLYVTNNREILYIYDMTGKLLKKIFRDNVGNNYCLLSQSRHVTLNESGNIMLVGGWDRGLVCLDGLGNHVSTIKDSDVDYADGVCVDSSGNVFVVGWQSHNVVQFSEDGKKVGVVVRKGDGLQNPLSVCFHKGLNRMFVTMQNSDVVKMYELE